MSTEQFNKEQAALHEPSHSAHSADATTERRCPAQVSRRACGSTPRSRPRGIPDPKPQISNILGQTFHGYSPATNHATATMSIVTKTGDQGTTGLMYNHRVPKDHPRVDAYGCVDELSAALGVARATARPGLLRKRLLTIQRDLVIVMGELATDLNDRARYQKDGFRVVSPEFTARLDAVVAAVEPQLGRFHDWVLPGGSRVGAALDWARAVCRRAERRVCALRTARQLPNPEIGVYLNRLADTLWLLVRLEERR